MLDDPTPKKAIELAIIAEELGERFYKRLAKKFAEDGELSYLFTQLAQDEAVHLKEFEKLRQQVEATNIDRMEYRQAQVLKATALAEFFSRNRGPFSDIEQIETVEEALEQVLRFERAVLAYYRELEKTIGKSEALQALIAAEARHVKSVENHLSTGDNTRLR